MLRLINVQQVTFIECDWPSPDFHKVTRATVDVADVDKQETLGRITFDVFCGSFGAKLLTSSGDELTKLTTIEGQLERELREYFARK